MQSIKSSVVLRPRQTINHHSYEMEKTDNYGRIDKEYDNVKLSAKSGDSLLISLVQGRPHLYVRTAKNQKDHVLGQQSWNEIADILEQPAFRCMKRWIQLRERYTKEKRLNEQNAKDGVVGQKCWRHWAEMGFLTEHVVSRTSFKNKLPRKRKRPRYKKSSDDETFSPEGQSSLSSSTVPITENLSVASPSPSSSTSATVVTEPELLSPVTEERGRFGSCDGELKLSVFHESIPDTISTVDNPSRSLNREIETSEDLFCRYLASELKKMSKEEKKNATKRLMNALFDQNT